MKPNTYQPAALNTLRRMPANMALKGSSAIRLRVGDWRVIMLDGDVIDVVRIGPRGGVYKE